MNKVLENVLSNHVIYRRVIIIFVIALLGIVDFATGYEYSFSVFYLLPVTIAAWYDNKRVIVLTIIFSAATWLTADLTAGHSYSNLFAPCWNTLVRIVFFSIVAFLLLKIRNNWEEMKQMAMRDSLTALNNTRAFSLQYQLFRKLNLRKKEKVAVAIIDLDGFKAVNDTLGHTKGDEVLVEFASVLKGATRNSDAIARMGGDEFAVLLFGADEHGVGEYDSRLRTHFLLSGLKASYGVDFSMGVMIFDELPMNLDHATRSADQLMYRSKELGKSQTSIAKM